MKTVILMILGLAVLQVRAGEPRPAKSDIEITAIYYPGTEHMPEWDMVAQTCPERKPLLGWFDEGNPDAIDWQIKWAVEHGITSFCVDWYWNRGFRRLEHWVKGFQKARYRGYLKWYMMYANHNQPGSHSSEDQVAVTRYWLENCFRTPEYYTIDGKPVVCIWDSGNIDRDFIAEAAAKGEKLAPGDGIRRAFAISERLVREAGLPGIHWQLMWRVVKYDTAAAEAAVKQGFESAVSYGMIRPSYDRVMSEAVDAWNEMCGRKPLDWWLPIYTGWDDRPRSFSRARVCRGRTVEKFARHCREAREYCEKKGIRHVIIHPINEWQEGSYIEPNGEYGFGMYQAIREAFCTRPEGGWPAEERPTEVQVAAMAFPPMYYSPVRHWDFEGTTEHWYRQPYGGGEVESHDGCLTFVINRIDNFNIRQRMVPFAASEYRCLRLRMRITPNARFGLGDVKTPAMRFKWGTAETPIIGPGLVIDNGRNLVTAPVLADGEFHEYTLDLARDPGWKGMVDELWFEASQVMHARVAIDWMRFE